MNINRKILILGGALFILGACATNIQNPTSLPTLLEYSEKYRAEFADELDKYCIRGEELTPKTCQFVQDSIELRSAIRAAQED